MATTATTTVDLTSYDVILVNSSGGKDSQAMLDYVAEQATAQGVRDRLVVVHCDLGRVEWKGVKALAAEQAAHYGVRFEVVTRTIGDLLSQVEFERKLWPSSDARFCTSDHKRSQVYKLLTALVKEQGVSRPVRILNCLGLRAQESPAREKCRVCKGKSLTDKRKGKKAAPKVTKETCTLCSGTGLRLELEADAQASNGKRTVDTWLPIHKWTETEVWARIKASGVRHHEAYDLGMPRLSCAFCIFAPKEALVLAGIHNPELLAEYVRVEEKIGHTFKHGLSLKQVQIEAQTRTLLPIANQPVAVANWCM